jgi:hypothetical protein
MPPGRSAVVQPTSSDASARINWRNVRRALSQFVLFDLFDFMMEMPAEVFAIESHFDHKWFTSHEIGSSTNDGLQSKSPIRSTSRM